MWYDNYFCWISFGFVLMDDSLGLNGRWLAEPPAREAPERVCGWVARRGSACGTPTPLLNVADCRGGPPSPAISSRATRDRAPPLSRHAKFWLFLCPRLYNLCVVRTHAPSETGELLTIKAAADALGVSEQTLRRWDRAGKLRPVRHPMNGYRLYRREVINDLKRRIRGTDVKR